MKKIYKTEIIGIGSYLPEKILTNDDLSKIIDTSNEWIIQRTGIKQRHIVTENELTSDLAYQAALEAIKKAKINKEQIDLIIIATSTPDKTFPSVASIVHKKLQILKPIPAFDIQVACAGFVYALSIANDMLQANSYENILIIGAEKMSSIVDYNDRSTCILFGDGAGAIILQKKSQENISDIIDSKLYNNGQLNNLLSTTGGICSTKTAGFITMNGQEIFKHAIENLSNAIEEIISKNNFQKNDIDLIILHQANSRIIEAIAKKIKISYEKFTCTVDRHGNTSAASIPLAMNVMIQEDKLKKNDLIILGAIGAGLSWGVCLLRF